MPQNDRETTVQQLKARIKAFIVARDWDQFHSPKDLAIGIITESSELLEHFRFRDEAEVIERLKDPQFRQDISDELADVFYFVLAFSDKVGIDLSDALETKMTANAQRYPVEKAKGKNLKYTAYE